jgi:hypothetical protein
MIENAIEKSGGVDITPVEQEKRGDAIRKDIKRILDSGEEY